MSLEARIADDRIIAALARETVELREKVAELEEAERRHQRWLREAKAAAGYDENVSFDVVWHFALEALQAARSKQ